MIQGHSIYCALYFFYYYISSTSDHQALDPGMQNTLCLYFLCKCFLLFFAHLPANLAHFCLHAMIKKKLKITNADRDMEKSEPSYNAGKDVK